MVILARSDCAERVADAMSDSQLCRPSGKGGRGDLLRFDCAGGTGLIRRYQRGGALRHVVKDAYVFINRPLREFVLHRHLLATGLDVPPLLGVCWSRSGLIYRGAIATVEIDGEDLLAHLQKNPDDRQTLQACGRLIRHMHDLRLWHGDLQLKNILVGSSGLLLIDFDKARLLPRLTPQQCARNLFRLRRSFEKHRFPLEYFEDVCAGYGVLAVSAWVDRLYEVKGRCSDWAARRPRR